MAALPGCDSPLAIADHASAIYVALGERILMVDLDRSVTQYLAALRAALGGGAGYRRDAGLFRIASGAHGDARRAGLHAADHGRI